MKLAVACRRAAQWSCLWLAALAAGGGCGGGSSGAATITVSAAASLRAAFTHYASTGHPARVSFSFAGSDVLATQIEQGLNPDVYAAANTKLPNLLFARGLVEKPVPFAANELVLAVPAGSRKIHSLADTGRPGVTLAIGSPTVPIGSYTQIVLRRLPSAVRARILANVHSQEPDVSGIVGKLTEGAVDAGFVYTSDVDASAAAIRAIKLPAALEPKVAYAAAVLRHSRHPDLARRFIAGLRSRDGQAALLRAGFLSPPRALPAG